MARPKTTRPARHRNSVEDRMVRGLDQLSEFEQFTTDLAPALRADLMSGMTAAQIYEKYTAHAAARGISIAMTERDTGKALKAIQDILDRSQGKAVQRVEAKHKFEDLSEEQLDALLLSKLRDGQAIDAEYVSEASAPDDNGSEDSEDGKY